MSDKTNHYMQFADQCVTMAHTLMKASGMKPTDAYKIAIATGLAKFIEAYNNSLQQAANNIIIERAQNEETYLRFKAIIRNNAQLNRLWLALAQAQGRGFMTYAGLLELAERRLLKGESVDTIVKELESNDE